MGLTLFSMFFGAGNLIFPPFLGFTAGTNTVLAFIGFAISAVGFPILSVMAVAKHGNLRNLTDKAGKYFSLTFTILIYLAIGPGLAIPRTGSTSFEIAIVPFLPSTASVKLFSILYSVLFFGIALLFALKPSKLVSTMGKHLSPILLFLILALFVGCVFRGITLNAGEPYDSYANLPVIKGFLAGYDTMDAIAGLVFGIVIAINIGELGITDKNSVVKCIFKAGYVAAPIFLIIYGILTYIGFFAATQFPGTQFETGAQILSAVAKDIFGIVGMFVIAIIFFVACLNVCISLLCCCAKYFNSLLPKISYNRFVFIFAVISAVIENAGLATILKISVPILVCLYPATIAYILLAFLPQKFQNRTKAFVFPLITVTFFGLLSALEAIGLTLPEFFKQIPLHSQGLGWIIPGIIATVLGLFMPEKKSAVN